MKQLHNIRLHLIAATLLLLSACATNNGDIGPLYGIWQLTDYTVGETTYTEDPQRYTTSWSFQNNILQIEQATPLHDRTQRTATYQVDDNTMTINFMHHDDELTPGTGIYQAPEWIQFPQGITTFQLRYTDNRHLSLTTTTDKGITIRYNLHKTY